MNQELLEKLQPIINAFNDGKTAKEVADFMDMYYEDILTIRIYLRENGLVKTKKNIIETFMSLPREDFSNYLNLRQDQKRRIDALKLLWESKSVTEICKEMGVGKVAIYHWVSVYLKHGISGILEISPKGGQGYRYICHRS
jgi:hypothetical protein